jgi:FtsP/CotA-like multicopper oxidase with cupredoxin domain
MKVPAMRLFWLLASTLPAAAQSFDPPRAIDVNPAPNVFEFDLEAAVVEWEYFPITAPGMTTTTWAYGDRTTGTFSVPGPTIAVPVNAWVIVNFTNNLPEATTIHWHGLEVPAEADGSHLSQAMIEPGETYTYQFRAINAEPDWYHPHVRTFDQVEKGLYGAFIVHDPAIEHALGLAQMEQHVVFFDDILLDAALQVVPAFSFTDPLENALYQLNGREGNYVLINGRESSNVHLPVPNGVPQRWRVFNAANTTFCRLDVQDPVAGFQAKLWEVGNDTGFLEKPFLKPQPVTSTAPSSGLEHPGQSLLSEMGEGILLLPGERFDVVFTPIGQDGEQFNVYQWDWFRGRHMAEYGPEGEIMLMDDPLDGAYPTVVAFTMETVGPDPGIGEWVPDSVAWQAAIDYPPLQPAVGELMAHFGHGMPDPVTGDVMLFAQAEMSMGGEMMELPMHMINSFNAQDVTMGETWDFQVVNMGHGDHPFHLHGFEFELLKYEWQDDLDPTNPNLNFTFVPKNRRIKDTVRIPAALGMMSGGSMEMTSRCIATLRVHFDDLGREGQASAMGSLPTFNPDGTWTSGGWMFHCHVLEHAEKGMMSWIEVHEADEIFKLLGYQKAGTGGAYPSITARGDLSSGSDLFVDMTDALPGKSIWLVVGDEAGMREIGGGTLVPVTSAAGTGLPFLGVYAAKADANGDFTWTFDQWELLPSGTTVYLQAAARDPGAQAKLVFSNAVEFTVP